MSNKTWKISGFSGLSEGTLGNSGQNLYVSRKGVLQRIWRFDVNNDGYVDLPVANSHGFNEHPMLHIISDPTGEAVCQEVLTQGAQSAVVADLNEDGYDDLIIAVTHDGQHVDLASYVYFGGADGITENRKIDLAAPACTCTGVGDFDADGKKEICYLIADDPDEASAAHRTNIRLRIYHQGENGFRMNDFRDFPADISYFCVCDVDGDGYDDLYCRKSNGAWGILWNEKGEFSNERYTQIKEPTDDAQRFEILPRGGGNVIYSEFAKPKILTLGGKQYLFYADAKEISLLHFSGRTIDEELVFPVGNVISAGVGHILRPDSEELVLLQVNGKDDSHVLVFAQEQGALTELFRAPVLTPRDVLLCDFSENGHDDIVVAQGRNEVAFTSESLLFRTNADGTIQPEPIRFETHNCVELYAADFCKSGKKQLVFVNQQQSTSYGHVPTYIYLGSKDGYSPERRLEFPGHSAGTIICADFTDDGWPDVLVLQNQEDQPFLNLPSNLYFGGPDGFDLERRLDIPAGMAWGGHIADLNKNGYLDIITVGGNDIRIFYGGPDGYSQENMAVLHPIPDAPEGTPVGALWPTIADLNGDGWLDLVVPLSWLPYSIIFWGGPDGFSSDRTTKLPVDDALEVHVADLNKDGYPEIIFGSRASYYRDVYNTGTVTIFWGGPEGYSGYRCCVLPSYQTNNITIQDFNNDGWLDIFASSYFNKKERDINSYIYWNDKGHFSLTNRKRFFTHSSSAAWAGDFNEDGYMDIFISNHRTYGNHNGESAIWWNGPEGFTEEHRTWLPTIGPHDMTPADIGDIMNRSPEETYMTPKVQAELHSVNWVAEIPWKTWVNCQIRSADSLEGLDHAEFVGPDGTADSRFENGQAVPEALIRGPYFQLKLYIGAVNSGNSPRITEIFTC